MTTSRKIFKCFLCLFLLIFTIWIVIGLLLLLDDQPGYYSIFTDEDVFLRVPDLHESHEAAEKEPITQPILLWWNPLTGEPGRYKKCGNVSCFFTVDRHYWHHHQIEVFLFYGTDFRANDLPLPRESHHQWALLHEESPKNNYLFSHADVMELFNHTSTFRRESDYCLVTQSVESQAWLQSGDYLISNNEKNKLLGDLAPVIYTHSDCDPPSDRDSYVSLLMKYLRVDSYGTCLHNKDLPDHLKDPIAGMGHKDFYNLVAKYKFSLAFENAICDDYITEKLWRALHVGSVPIVFGSSRIRDLLPDNHSAILIEDFETVEDLAKYLKFLLDNDAEYEKYLDWKKTGVTNPILKKLLNERQWQTNEDFKYNEINFIDGFECFLCQRIHENRRRRNNGVKEVGYQATVNHYGCPRPRRFDSHGRLLDTSSWVYEWDYAKFVARALKHLMAEGRAFKKEEIEALASKYWKQS